MKDHIYSVKATVEDHRRLDDWITPTTSDINPQHNSSSNGSAALPLYMVFNDGHRLSIAVYSVLMVFSTIANITVLVLLVKRKRQQPSRINTMLMHLAIADLLVSICYVRLVVPEQLSQQKNTAAAHFLLEILKDIFQCVQLFFYYKVHLRCLN